MAVNSSRVIWAAVIRRRRVRKEEKWDSAGKGLRIGIVVVVAAVVVLVGLVVVIVVVKHKSIYQKKERNGKIIKGKAC